ncbi:MAG: hypothetical protein D6714_13655 [Bacteroidetes bacterium]|nr:MAG: hypothetical protein D6714_13655 [Bacteroidota bacterium]
MKVSRLAGNGRVFWENENRNRIYSPKSEAAAAKHFERNQRTQNRKAITCEALAETRSRVNFFPP